MKDNRLRYLLNGYYWKTASSSEVAELMKIIGDKSREAEIKKEILILIKTQNSFDKSLDQRRTEEILANIMGTDEKSESQINDFVFNKISEKKWVIRNAWVAASIILVLCIPVLLFYFSNVESKIAGTLQRQDSIIEITPENLYAGQSKALLTLWDGTEFDLGSTEAKSIEGRTLFENYPERGELIIGEANSTEGYNTITTPLGGQYKIVLSDGSKVWLNAGSSLRFPNAFGSASRTVSIEGEAFFDVMKNDRLPFIVSIHQQPTQSEPLDVVVMGTEFNVTSYLDEPAVQTTLVRGSVLLKKGMNSYVLAPGEQAAVQFSPSASANLIEIKQVDTESVVAWKEGRFEFNGTIEEIMRQIARWYAVEVEFEDEIRSKVFMGTISRKENAEEVLKMLELTGGIRFEIVGRKIYVKSGTE